MILDWQQSYSLAAVKILSAPFSDGVNREKRFKEKVKR